MKKTNLRRCDECGYLFKEEMEFYIRGVPHGLHCIENQETIVGRKPVDPLKVLSVTVNGQTGYIYACPVCGAWLHVESISKKN